MQVQLRFIMNWLKVAHHQSTLIARLYARVHLLDDLLTNHMTVVGRKAAIYIASYCHHLAKAHQSETHGFILRG